MKTPGKGRAGVFVEERRGERWRREGTRRSYSPMQTKLSLYMRVEDTVPAMHALHERPIEKSGLDVTGDVYVT
ncbi:hypothetical protein GW17_00044654 [Ensete ventricosum]|nr:hypothetical protein GW17_00044654 [Ensete ventricosum]